MRGRLAAGVAAAIALAIPTAAAAEIRALIVAEAAYRSSGIASLEGPPNDAAALRTLLAGEGATDVVVLQDAAATRTSIRAALQGLGARAKAGDWVVFFYAGHGAQAKARGTDEADGLDEFLVLTGFDVAHPDTEQFVLDNELRGWLANFFARDVNVLQIADACHSGTLNRAPAARTAFRSRQALAQPLAVPLPPAPDDPAAVPPPGDPPNLIYVGAAQDDQFALEGPLPRGDSPYRGLLTFALQVALSDRLDGRLAADLDADGQLSLGELAAALETRTREFSGAQQWASAYLPAGNEESVVFRPLQAPEDEDPPITVKAADDEAARILSGRGPWASLMRGEPDLTWSARGGVVMDARGDRIAEGLKSADDLAAVIAKRQALAALYRRADERKLKVEVGPLPRGRLYHEGQDVEIAVRRDGAAAWLTVFNLAGNGLVQRLYPLNGDGPGRLEAGATRLVLGRTQATAPFGVDHVVAVVTAAEPTLLRSALARAEGRRAAGVAADVVRQQLAAGDGALALGELYTGP